MGLTIYSIKNCDTMKKALVRLDQHGVENVFHNYRGQNKSSAKSYAKVECVVAYAEIAADAFPHLADISDGSRAEACVAALQSLIGRLQMPMRLRDMNIPGDALPRMASDAMKQQRLLVNNPRPVSETDALAIYREAW